MKDGLSKWQSALASELGLDDSPEEMSKAATPIVTSTLSGAAGLTEDIPDTFIDLTVDETVLLKHVRLFRTNAPSGNLAKIDVSGPVTRLATENTTSTETRSTAHSSVPYATAKIRSDFDISAEVEEDNIEGPGGVNTILGALMKAVANDTEDLSIQGDTSLGGSDDTSSLLKANDGWNVLTATGTGTHQLDASGTRVSWALLKQMLTALPTRYRSRVREDFMWIMSANTVLDLIQEAETRATDLGDRAYNREGELAPLGIKVLEVPKIPEDLSVSGTDSTGTFIWLMNPKNFVYVVQRNIKVIREFQPRTDTLEVSVTQRNDYVVENTDSIVKATGVILDNSASRFS